jgi:hypothetical protein
LPLAIVFAIVVPDPVPGVIPFGAAIGQGDSVAVSVGLLAGPYRLFVGVIYGALLAGVDRSCWSPPNHAQDVHPVRPVPDHRCAGDLHHGRRRAPGRP